MNFNIIFISLFSFISFSVTSQAQMQTPQVNQRQGVQQKRIHQGIKSGELTKGEVVKLEQQQKRVQKHKELVKSDGVVTKKERKGLRLHQQKASQNIYRKKHNRIRRK